jgi:Tol biopolymer transport system component
VTSIEGDLCIVNGETGEIEQTIYDDDSRQIFRLGSLDPHWSVYDKIVFIKSDSIFRINADGEKMTFICGTINWLNSPKWSPDGSSLAFNYSTDIIFADKNNHIYVVPADTTGGFVPGITDPLMGAGDGVNIGGMGRLDWWRDSSNIAFIDGDRNDVRLIDVHTKNMKWVTNDGNTYRKYTLSLGKMPL